MSLPSDTYRQLTSMANAADRGNRPTTFLVVAAIAIIAGFVVLVMSWNSYSGTKKLLQDQEGRTRNIANAVATLEALEAKTVDFREIYPPVPQLELKILDAYERAGIPFERDPTVAQPQQTNLPTFRGLSRTTVKCNVNNDKLEYTLQWIDNVVHHPDLEGRVFVDSITLTPFPNSDAWSAQIEFAIYESRRN